MGHVHDISVEQAKQWLDAGEAVMIDIREQTEHTQGHIPGIPLLIMSQTQWVPTVLPEHTGKKFLIHCRSGGRSRRVAEELIHQGYEGDLYNVAGGLLAWQAAGYDMEGTVS